MDNNQFEIIKKKLDAMLGLLTLNFTQGKTLQDRVELLFSLGLSAKEISNILGKSPTNIHKNLERIKKKIDTS